MAENKNTFIDRDTGQKISLDDSQYDYVSDVESKLGGPRYVPASGSMEVAIQDNDGIVHVRELSPDAYFSAKKAGKTNVVRVTDANREQFKAIEQEHFQQQVEQHRAQGAGGFEVFLENLVPGARSMQRIGLTEEQQERHGRIQEMEDEEHPIAAVAGDIGQLIGTSLIPIPGLGTAGRAASAGTRIKTAARAERALDDVIAAEYKAGRAIPDAELGQSFLPGRAPEALYTKAGAWEKRVSDLAESGFGKGAKPAHTTVEDAGGHVLEYAQFADTATLPGGKAPASAMHLMGFSRHMGDVVRAETALRGAEGIGAQLAGNVVAGATMNLPLAIQYEAAQAFDYNKPLVTETFMQDVGTDMLLGAIIDTAFPLIGRGARTILKASPTVSAFEDLAGVGKKAIAKKVGRNVSSVFPKSPAKRVVTKKAVDEGLGASEKLGYAIRDMEVPSNGKWVSSRVTKAAKAVDDLAELTPEVMDLPEFAYLKENVKELDGIHLALKGTKNNRGLVDGFEYTADTIAGDMRGLTLNKVSFKNADPSVRVDFAGAVARIQDQVSPEAAAMLQEFKGGVESFAGPTSEGAQRLLNFRNRVALDAASGDPLAREIVDVVRAEVDALLTNPNRVGDAAENLATILRGVDDAIDAASTLKEAEELLDLGRYMLPEDADVSRYRDAVLQARGAYDTLGSRGTLNPKFVQGGLEKGLTAVNKVEPKLKAQQALNRVRAFAGERYRYTAGGSPDNTENGIIRSGVEWVGKYIRNVKDAATFLVRVDERIARGAGRQAASIVAWNLKDSAGKDYGVYRFRNMKELSEKRAAFEEIRANLRTASANTFTLQDGVARFTSGLQQSPELAQHAAYEAVRKIQFLANELPQSPQGIVGDDELDFSPAEIANFLEVYGAAEDPLSVMETIGTGTLSEDALRTVATLYPATYADMQVTLSETIAKNKEAFKKLPFAIRSDIDRFLGGGYVQANQPSTFINFQNKAAQTQAQQQAIAGRGGAFRAPQPGMTTASDNLAKL